MRNVCFGPFSGHQNCLPLLLLCARYQEPRKRKRESFGRRVLIGEKEPVMKLSRVGVDLAKNVYQLHGVDRHGKTVWKRRAIQERPADGGCPRTDTKAMQLR